MADDTKLDDHQVVLDSRLIERFEVHRDFTRVFLDAFILINARRRVLKFNQAFSTIVGLRAIDVRKASSVDELFLTEIKGSYKSAVDLILESTCPLRIDEVQAKRPNSDATMQLIISSYPYFDSDSTLLGACVLLRDVTAESNLQGKYKERTIQSITDPLTGLFVRRYFEDWLDKEVERSRAAHIEANLGVLMFDLDKFKNVNDTYGHQAGDYVLVETAKVLREHSRKTDILGRYGGEELLVILVGASQKGCCAAAEKFRQAIQSHDYVFNGVRIPVTSSVGVSMFQGNTETRTEVVKRADECLYAAKKNGRNVAFCNFGGEITRVVDILGESDVSLF